MVPLAKDPRAIEASNIKLPLELLRGSGRTASGTNSPEVTVILQKFTQFESELARARLAGPTTTSATTTGPAAAAPDSAGVRSRTVNINLGGRSRSVGVSSQADSDVLVGVLRDLETGGRVAQHPFFLTYQQC